MLHVICSVFSYTKILHSYSQNIFVMKWRQNFKKKSLYFLYSFNNWINLCEFFRCVTKTRMFSFSNKKKNGFLKALIFLDKYGYMTPTYLPGLCFWNYLGTFILTQILEINLCLVIKLFLHIPTITSTIVHIIQSFCYVCMTIMAN